MSKLPDRKALGKGLSALLPARATAPPTSAVAAPPPAEPRTGLTSLPIDAIDPNPLQPRTVFQPERLVELSQSIQANGIIQPLVVLRKGDRYQLVAGERRWRAAKLAGLHEVPVVVQDFADERLLEIALIENIQREDLNPIEVAQAFDRLGRELKLSHEEIGRRTGKDRTTVTNMLRLLKLPVRFSAFWPSTAYRWVTPRAILGIAAPESQLEVAEKAAAQGLSVREVERLVQKLSATREPKVAEEEVKLDPNVKAAIRELEHTLGTRVRIVEKSEQRGRIEIEYYTQEDLQRIYTQIVGDSDTQV